MQMAARRRVHVEGPGGVGVPFTEVTLGGDEPPFRLYDTSGPGSDPATGLPPLRRPWILDRRDVKAYEGRLTGARDDGRGAVRRGTVADQFRGPTRKRRPNHGCHPIFRLRAAGPQRSAPGADYGKVGGQPYTCFRCASRSESGAP